MMRFTAAGLLLLGFAACSTWRGMPTHGGFGMGLERLLMQLAGLTNLRETTLFPRDLERLAP